MFYYHAFGLTIRSEFRLSSLLPVAEAPADVTICRAKLDKPNDWFTTKINRAGLQARFSQTKPDEYWLDWTPVGVFRATAGHTLTLDSTQADEALLDLFTVSEALGLLLFQRGYFLLHGSAISIDDRGLVFLGEPGAGKSTTAAAFARQGFPLLSDDLVCISLDERNRPWIIPAYPQIKLWESSVDGLNLQNKSLNPVREGSTKVGWQGNLPFQARPVRVEQIYVLTPPTEHDHLFVNVSPNQIPVELLRHFPLADTLLKGQRLYTYFQQSTAIAHCTPLVRLSRPSDFIALSDLVVTLLTIDHDGNG